MAFAAECAVGLLERAPGAARTALFGLIVVDLVVNAWGVNPTFNPAYLAEPAWLSLTHAHPDSRFYVGGKTDGTLDASDLDSSGAYLNPPGLSGSASRAALSGQANFNPSGWRSREMLSYDLAVLWPRDFATMSKRFFLSGRLERDWFLDRTGVRYRVLPRRQAGGRTPIVQVPYLMESFLFDYGSEVAPRVMVVSNREVVGDVEQQIEALFTGGWDIRSTAIIDHEPAVAGHAGRRCLRRRDRRGHSESCRCQGRCRRARRIPRDARFVLGRLARDCRRSPRDDRSRRRPLSSRSPEPRTARRRILVPPARVSDRSRSIGGGAGRRARALRLAGPFQSFYRLDDFSALCEFAILGVQRDRAGCRGAEFDRRADGNGCHCRGGAGFIGSTVVDRLLLDGHAVVAFDDFSTGLERFLEYAVSRREFMLVRGDALDSSALTSAMRGADVVFHLAANADVRFGTNYPRRDLRAKHHRDLQRARGDARERHAPHRLFVHRLDLRGGDRDSDSG